MIGYTEICQPSDRDDFGSLVDDVDIVINGTGDYCRSEDNIYGKGRSWRKSASEMYGEESGAPSDDYIQIVGGRILIIKPPLNWFEVGCLYNVTVQRGNVITVEEPAKAAPFSSFAFFFVDIRPELLNFRRDSSTTTGAHVSLRWKLQAQSNCTIVPVNSDCSGGYNGPNQSALCNPCILKCQWQVLDDQLQPSLASDIQYSITGLYPGITYRAHCMGIKFDNLLKPWIETVPVPQSRMEEMELKTKYDDDDSLSRFNITVIANCPDPDGDVQVYQEDIPVDAGTFGLGHTMQIAGYRDRCNDGRPLGSADTGSMTFKSTAHVSSKFANITWKNGPDVSLPFTAGSYDLVMATLEFVVCSLAAADYPDSFDCKTYNFAVRCIDVNFFLRDMKIQSDVPVMYNLRRLDAMKNRSIFTKEERAVRRLETGSAFSVDVGTVVSIEVEASLNAFNWDEADNQLGPPKGVD
jgi:hypothetical protein